MNKTLKLLACALCAGGSMALGASATGAGPTVTVHDLLVAALNTNIELTAKRIDPQIADFRVSGAKGAFDPAFAIGGFKSSSTLPQNQREFLATGSILTNGQRIYQEELTRYEAGFIGKLQTGANYTLSTSIERSNNTFNRQATALYHPEFTSKTTLAITQPLLRDFGFAANLAEVRLSRSAAAISRHEVNATVIKVMATVLNAYYEMVFGQENLVVKQQAVALAENLVHESERRADEGKMSKLDIIQARGRLSETKEELILARNFLAQRRNTLRELTRDKFDLDEGEWSVDGSFLIHAAPALDRNRLLAKLFEINPAYLASLEQARSEDLRIAYAKNQAWPRVDLKASIGENGLKGDWSGAYSNYSDHKEPDWSAGLIVNIPLTRRAERAKLGEAKSRKLQALLNIKRNEILLLSAFDTALRDVRAAEERIAIVQESARLAASALDAEEKRLATGVTTSYNVGVVQKDLSTIRSREQATYVDLSKAVTQLYVLIGNLPEQMHTEVKTN